MTHAPRLSTWSAALFTALHVFAVVQSDPPTAAAAEYDLTTLVTFDAANGRNPAAGLISDADGNLYGTTQSGGTSSAGNVFKIAAGSNTITTLATFNFTTDGGFPLAGVIADSGGSLYGTTSSGNINSGTVFEVASGSNALTTLAAFSITNGANPSAGLVADAAGNLYGTTAAGGGPAGAGTVFEIAAGSHTFSTFATFNGTNGSSPLASLISDAAGNLYGTTFVGGAFNRGTVFEIAAGSHTITTLATFDDANGARPVGSLLADAAGNLYGTTSVGGASGDGTVFEIAAGSHTLTTFATFDGTNGANPLAGLIADSAGNLYGTTQSGGGPAGLADGTVFEIAAGSNTITTLVTFNGANGANPQAGLLLDAAGNLYGTTYAGGANGDGTVFKLSPVPEPSSLALGALATGILFLYGRRRACANLPLWPR